MPRNVEFVDGSAFSRIKSICVLLEAGHANFAIEQDFLVDVLNQRLICSFSSSSNIEIPRDIEILGSSCFFHCESLSSISFESNSHLNQIESEAFRESSLKSIEIPRSVVFIDGSAFV
jgi:hypothetical protein